MCGGVSPRGSQNFGLWCMVCWGVSPPRISKYLKVVPLCLVEKLAHVLQNIPAILYSSRLFSILKLMDESLSCQHDQPPKIIRMYDTMYTK